jgi:hypothetical protein
VHEDVQGIASKLLTDQMREPNTSGFLFPPGSRDPSSLILRFKIKMIALNPLLYHFDAPVFAAFL